MARVEILREVPDLTNGIEDWTLCFHWCRYHYDEEDRPPEMGYRFIWRRPDGSLQAARGQARIGSANDIRELINLATEAGWYEVIERQ